MAITVTGRIIKAKSKEDLDDKEPRHWFSLDYSHIRVQFNDGGSRNFLFTNKQISRALERGLKYKNRLPQITWMREFWYDNIVVPSSKDIEEDIDKYELPKLAKKYNHIRVEINGKEKHLLFSLKDVEKAFYRAKQLNKKLPKLSWIIEK